MDVYAPRTASSPLPVVFWLYGGSLIAGSTQDYTHLERLVTRANVVLVAVNYRLGAFGWLALPELSASDPRGSSGNYGILDQQEALRWVQHNIASFGGDPSRVTLMGQSSGGTSILALLASPASKALFSGAISLSASPNITVSLSRAQAKFQEGVTGGSDCYDKGPGEPVLTCLYNLSALELASLLPDSFALDPMLPGPIRAQRGYPGLPIVDGVTLSLSVLDAIDQGVACDVNLILQTMSAEMDTYEANATIYAMNSSDYFSLVLQETFSAWELPSAAAETVQALYALEQTNSTELTYQTFMADYSFLCGSAEIAILAAQRFKSRVYLSVGAHAPSHPLFVNSKTPSLYAGHNWDYVSALGAYDMFSTRYGVPPYTDPSASDLAFGQLLVKGWASFAANASAANMLPVNAVEGFPREYVANVQKGGQAVHVANFAQQRCTQLRSSPLFLNQSYWLTN